MRFWVYGLDATSKAPRDPLFVEADSEDAARARAGELGMHVQDVEPVAPRAAPPPPPATPRPTLRSAILTVAGLVLFVAGAAAGWFSARRAAAEPQQKEAVKHTSDEPALEEVEEAEDALRAAGFAEAFVYRWRGADLEGSLLVDTPRGPERVSLGLTPGGKPDPSFRGLIMIAIRPEVAGTTGRECVWGVVTNETVGADRVKAIRTPSTGRLPVWAGTISRSGRKDVRQVNLALPGGEKREVFNLRLRGRE